LLYADGIVIMGNIRHEVVTRTDDLLNATKPMELEVNQDIIKYIVMSRGTKDDSNRNTHVKHGKILKKMKKKCLGLKEE